MKLVKISFLLVICIACKSKKIISSDLKAENKLPLLTNDSVLKFIEIDKKITQKVEDQTSFSNPITKHFSKQISKKTLQKVEFKEWRQKIYIEFSINKRKEITYLDTNTANKKLDKQLKKAFKKIDFNLFEFPEYDSRYKFTLVVIQEDFKGEPIIKCSNKVIGYTPPVFEICNKETTYHGLNSCNYLHISNHIYQNIDISLISNLDIENKHQIFPKFIIDKKGKVIAAKIESKNKKLIESYYKTIKNLPRAESPAKINGEPYYFGYNFPSTISNLIKNNEKFKKYYSYQKDSGDDINQSVKNFIQMEILRKDREKIYRVGF